MSSENTSIESPQVSIGGFRIARQCDIGALVYLVNRAYRPENGASGWTHESDLISGLRINAAQATRLIAQPDSLVVVQMDRDAMTACVHIKKDGDSCHIGMLAVSPDVQGAGVGKHILEFAERLVIREFGSSLFVLDVITAREGLMSFYSRRGYHRTGMVYPYPLEAGVGVPRCSNLYVEVMAKCAVDVA